MIREGSTGVTAFDSASFSVLESSQSSTWLPAWKPQFYFLPCSHEPQYPSFFSATLNKINANLVTVFFSHSSLSCYVIFSAMGWKEARSFIRAISTDDIILRERVTPSYINANNVVLFNKQQSVQALTWTRSPNFFGSFLLPSSGLFAGRPKTFALLRNPGSKSHLCGIFLVFVGWCGLATAFCGHSSVLEKACHVPLCAQKRWFLEHTRTLRYAVERVHVYIWVLYIIWW